MQKVVVVVGAGASAGCAEKGGGAEKTPDWRPPTVGDLLSGLDDPNSLQTKSIANYPGARAIANWIRTHRLPGEFEKHLEFFALHDNPKERAKFKDMVLYLHLLFTHIQEGYLTYPGHSHYLTLFQALRTATVDTPEHNVLVLSLNYDLFCESAAGDLDDEYNIQGMDDYVCPELGMSIVKLHGSIDWFFQLQDNLRQNWSNPQVWRDNLASVDPRDLPDGPITFARIHSSNIESAPGILGRVEGADHHQYFPCMTAPLASKSMRDVVCPDKHVAYAREFITDCDKFLFIGTSFRDVDLLELLNSSIRTPPRVVHVVDNGPGDGLLGRLAGAVGGIDRPIHRKTTFADYVRSVDFRTFLQ